MQWRCSSSSANGVVREDCERPIQHVAGTKPPHSSRHAMAEVHVKAGLRTVVSIDIADRNLRSRGELLLLRNTAERRPCVENVCGTGLLLQLDRNRFRVTIFNR